MDIRGNGPNELTLTPDAVRDISPATKTLTVHSNTDDTAKIGTGWTFNGTEVDSGVFVRILTQGDATLRIAGPRDWTYPQNPLDTSANGSIEPRDALIAINELNRPQYFTGNGSLVSAAGLSQFPGFFYDAAPDGFIVPRDVLVVINT